MSPETYRQTPDRTEETETETEAETDTEAETENNGAEGAQPPASSFEQLVEEMIQSRIGELEQEIRSLEEQLEEVDNFTRISLNERKVQRTESNLSEFSDSLTGFAEKAFGDINELEDRLDAQSMVLAAILEGLADSDVDLDLTEVERYQKDQVVMNASPEERLQSAVERF
jgi:TolA-binding protein